MDNNKVHSNSGRLKELDFLRGVAVIVVLFRHYYFLDFTMTMGWIGVDLFFVLSGFLISGLLFKEYFLFGDIKARLFLIRRGFKIYPLFYSFIGVTLIFLYGFDENFSTRQLIAELVFLQNYLGGLWPHTWSLAVEEHFYFLIIIVFPFLIKYQLMEYHKFVIFGFTLLMVFALLIRFTTNLWLFPNHNNLFNTHLRFDSLLGGVLISYLFYFRRIQFEVYFTKYKKYILPLAFAFLSFTPFVSIKSFFVKTVGFSFVYLGFGLILIYFLVEPRIVFKLERLFGKLLVGFVSKVGISSYSIYLFHLFISKYLMKGIAEVFTFSAQINFVIYFMVSIVVGMIFSRLVELPTLKLRDIYFPSRSQA